jgi:hypothetical protein
MFFDFTDSWVGRNSLKDVYFRQKLAFTLISSMVRQKTWISTKRRE